MESVREKIWLVVQELQSHPPPNLPLERLCRNYYFVTLNLFQGLAIG